MAHVFEPYSLDLAGDHRTAAAQWDDPGGPYDAALALAGADDEAAAAAMRLGVAAQDR